jgi:flagellar biosynthesis protein FlhG
VPADTHYDALGLSPKATRDQIDKAYKFCLDMYRDGALATYSLLDAGDAETARTRIARAYEVLADADRRRAYDESLGVVSEPALVVPFAVNAADGSAAASLSAPSPDVGADALTGADLRRIRESRGVSLREISTASKVGVRFLEYIEEDRFALLPPPVYLRGFLQEFARALGIDPRRAADAYMSRIPPRD